MPEAIGKVGGMNKKYQIDSAENREFLRKNADMTHEVMFDSSKRLKEQAISKESKEILAMLYNEYICKDETEEKVLNTKNNLQEKLLSIFKSKTGGEK